MIAALVAVFVLSGAAGLIYESIWTRYLGLFVGHSAYAQIIVLVIFLGGMSLGAHLAGRWSSRLRFPLYWYAGAELIVALLAFGFHDVFVAATGWAYDSVFPSLNGFALIAAKWTIAGALILPQSILLGSTFPLMSAGVIRLGRSESAPGGTLSLLYFANSLGAAVGVILAGFVFINEVGLPGTILVAALMNTVAAGGVALVARIDHRRGGARLSTTSEALPAGETLSALERRALLWVAFGTAIASFIYEIAWIRMLSLVLGSATHSFETMLSAFILGLALGALWIRSRADRIQQPLLFLGRVQWMMGVLAIVTLPLYIRSFDWMATVIATVQHNASGYLAFGLIKYTMALVIMLPATFCAGMTLPLITRLLMRGSARGAGERAIGTVYAVNTLGSIAGVALAGLALMPLLGLKKLLIFGAAVDIGFGVVLVVLAYRNRPNAAATDRWPPVAWPPLLAPVVVSAIVLAIVIPAAPFAQVRLSSGVYRHGVVEKSSEYTFPYYKDGRTATVSMRRSPDGFLTLATNGKPDASMEKAWMDTTDRSGTRQLTRDIASQLLLPTITLAHAPLAENAAVIGFGSGMSTHVLLGSPHMRQVVTIEIEPEMINAAKAFRPANRRAYDDKRSQFVIDDAKSYFAASRRKFDLILSEPSNPWVSGVSGLFTQEFYNRVRGQLTPTGVFGQWLHLYELNDGLVNSVMAAIDTAFVDYEVFYTSGSDILIVASNRQLPAPEWNVVSYGGLALDLRPVVPFWAQSFEALRLVGRDVLHPMLRIHGQANSDFYPVLDLNAEQMRFMGTSAEGYEGMSEGRFDVVAALSGRRVPFGTNAYTPTPEVARSEALALGARLRAIRTLPTSQTADLPRDEELRDALYRIDELERVMSTGKAPADWHGWTNSLVAVDKDLHSGTAGVIDSAFFRQAKGFVQQAGAPLEARAAVDFLEGIGAWNWPQAAVSAKAIMDSREEESWVPDDLLRNGAVVANIAVRDTAAARNALRYFAKKYDGDRFRERLLSAVLIDQDPALRRKMGWK